MDADESRAPSRKYWWNRFWDPDGLRVKIALLDDTKLVRLRASIYSDPRGLKGMHIRMVAEECARRGL